MERFNFRRLVNVRIVYGGLGLLLLSVILIAVGGSVLFVTQFQGDDAWPSGVFLAMLVLYCLSALWRYKTQQIEDRRRQRDEEDARYEFY